MAANGLPALVSELRRRLLREPPAPVAAGPPIEQLAADLRRLLAKHDAICSSPNVTYRASRIRGVEGALTDCAFEAARALGVDTPARPAREPLPPRRLRSLLCQIAASGIVLPGVHHFNA